MAETKPINFKLEIDTSGLIERIDEIKEMLQELEGHIQRVEDLKDSVVARSSEVGINVAGDELLDAVRATARLINEDPFTGAKA
jgi:hypothetical protein